MMEHHYPQTVIVIVICIVGIDVRGLALLKVIIKTEGGLIIFEMLRNLFILLKSEWFQTGNSVILKSILNLSRITKAITHFIILRFVIRQVVDYILFNLMDITILI